MLHDHCIRRCNLQLYQRGETVNFFGIATRWYEELKGFFIIKKSTLRLRSFTFFISFIWLTHGPMAPWPTFGYIFGDMLTQLILIIPHSSSLARGPPMRLGLTSQNSFPPTSIWRNCGTDYDIHTTKSFHDGKFSIICKLWILWIRLCINDRFECIEVRFVDDEIQIKLFQHPFLKCFYNPNAFCLWNILYGNGFNDLFSLWNVQPVHFSTQGSAQTSYISSPPTYECHLFKNSELSL